MKIASRITSRVFREWHKETSLHIREWRYGTYQVNFRIFNGMVIYHSWITPSLSVLGYLKLLSAWSSMIYFTIRSIYPTFAPASTLSLLTSHDLHHIRSLLHQITSARLLPGVCQNHEDQVCRPSVHSAARTGDG